MQETLITMDAALSARLTACRQLFLHLDAGAAEGEKVRLPEGGSAFPGLRPGEGLRASGALLAYALLGRVDADAEALMKPLAQDAPDRQIRRVCQTAADMMGEEPSFQQAGLYACLRTALVFLPESREAEALPGLMLPGEKREEAGRSLQTISARYAWAGNAAIAYFDLPEGVSEARVGDQLYSRDQCFSGVCLPPEAESVPVAWEGGGAALTPRDPLQGLRLTVGFRIGAFFIRANRVPKFLWKRMTPWIRVQGPIGRKTPDMTVVTSAGQNEESESYLPQGTCYLRCPRLDAEKDACVELRLPGVRYLDLTGEG